MWYWALGITQLEQGNMNSEDIKTSEMINHLILQGALEMSGIDEETGEMLYSITEKLKEVNPIIYDQLVDQFRTHMFELVKQGPIIANWRVRI